MLRAALARFVVIGLISTAAVAASPPTDDATVASELLRDPATSARALFRIANTLTDPQHARLAGDCFWEAARRGSQNTRVTSALRRTAWKRWLEADSLSHASRMLADWADDPSARNDAERQLVRSALETQRFDLAVRHARRCVHRDDATDADRMNLHWAITSMETSSEADVLASVDWLSRFAEEHPDHAAAISARRQATACVQRRLDRLADRIDGGGPQATQTLWRLTVRLRGPSESTIAVRLRRFEDHDSMLASWCRGIPDDVSAELEPQQTAAGAAARQWAAERLIDRRRFADIDEALRLRPPRPTDRGLRAVWADALSELGQVESALKIWRKLVAGAEDASVPLRWRIRLAECEVAAGDSATRAGEAIDAVAQAIDAVAKTIGEVGETVDRDHGDGHRDAGNATAMLAMLRGQLAIRRADIDASIAHFQDVVSHPGPARSLKPRAQFLIGECLLMQKNFAAAIDAYRAAIELAAIELAGVELAGVELAGDGGGADGPAPTIRDNVTPLAWLQTGKAHQSLGRTRQAAICYTRVIDVYQEHACAAEASARLATLRRPGVANPPAASHR